MTGRSVDDGSNDHRRSELKSGREKSLEVSARHLLHLTRPTSGEHVNVGYKDRVVG